MCLFLSGGFLSCLSILFQPTVPVGEERLRITPTPGHTVEQLAHLLNAIESVFNKLNLKRTADWASIGGRAGVGASNAPEIQPLWNDEQLGLTDGSAPVVLQHGKKMTTDLEAAELALRRFTRLLGSAKVQAEVVAVQFENVSTVDIHAGAGNALASRPASSERRAVEARV